MAKLFQTDRKPTQCFVIYTKLDTVIEIASFDEADLKRLYDTQADILNKTVE